MSDWIAHNELNEVMWRKCKMEMLRDPNMPKIAKDRSCAEVSAAAMPNSAGMMYWCRILDRKTREELARFPMLKDTI